MVDEICINVAVSLEIGGGESPGVWSGITSLNVLRDGATLEKPDLDVVGGPLHCVYTPIVGVEAETVAVGIRAVQIITSVE